MAAVKISVPAHNGLSVTPGPLGDQGPPTRSPIPFLLGWFVIPLIVVLILDRLHVFERIAEWFGLS